MFESVALSGNVHHDNIPPVLTMWLTGVAIMCVNYFIEGTVMDRFIFFSNEDFNQFTQYVETEVMTVVDPEHTVPVQREDRDIYGSPSTSLSPESSVSMDPTTSSDDSDEDEKLDEIIQKDTGLVHRQRCEWFR